MRIADFTVPDTLAARGALELATQYQSPAITAHALRSWLWAEAFARVDGITDIVAAQRALLADPPPVRA